MVELRREVVRKPTGVYVDGNDIVYVCDSQAEIIALFDAAERHLRTWDLAVIYGSRSEPEDIIIDPAGERICVAEVLGHRVLHLEAPTRHFSVFP